MDLATSQPLFYIQNQQFVITHHREKIKITDGKLAFQTGFTSGSHYTKTFREMVGCTPTEYRNTNPGIGAYAQHYEHAI